MAANTATTSAGCNAQAVQSTSEVPEMEYPKVEYSWKGTPLKYNVIVHTNVEDIDSIGLLDCPATIDKERKELNIIKVPFNYSLMRINESETDREYTQQRIIEITQLYEYAALLKLG